MSEGCFERFSPHFDVNFSDLHLETVDEEPLCGMCQCQFRNFFSKCFTWHLLLTHWYFRFRMLHKYWWSTFLSSRDKNDEVTSNGSFLPQNEHTGNTCLNSTRFKSKHYISRYVCISVKWVAYKNPIICDALQVRAMIYNISPAF